jgi:predicted ATP-binding protein involved in virulence
MRIKKIVVEGLFNYFNHSVELHMADRVTIMHAPNGFGKTAILLLTEGLFRPRYHYFRTLPFKRFLVTFDSGAELVVTKSAASKGKKGHERDSVNITVQYGQESLELASPERQDIHVHPDMLESIIPELTRIGIETWRAGSGETLDLDEVIENYPELLPHRQSTRPSDAAWLKELRSKIDVRFIRTDRLTIPSITRPSRGSRHVSGPSVNSYSEELASEIKSTLASYAELSQSLDRTFPSRLVMDGIPPNSTRNPISEKLRNLEEKRKKLTDAGLLDQEKAMPFDPATTSQLDESKLGVLAVYVADVEKKLSVFDALLGKIDLFKKIVNERFRHKQLSISRDRGLVFRTDDDASLAPQSLSSGEQHEIVLLYELLFKVKEDSLVLIDEPEISLHVAWQEEFLQDLLEMTRLSRFDVLLATHSPQIISDRWDLTVELRDSGR